MATEGIDRHKALFLLLNKHHGKSNEKVLTFASFQSFCLYHSHLVWKHSDTEGTFGK